MPKGSPELTEKRINEILNACEKIYTSQGFYGVNIKEISTEISLSRPSIYNYFETKEEILLGLLIREYSLWCNSLKKIAEKAKDLNREALANEIAHSLEDKVTLLRILNMNLFEIELNSRVERLAEFKKVYKNFCNLLLSILQNYKSISLKECDEFTQVFSAFLFGIFPFTTHTEKQIEAMKIAEVTLIEPSIYDMVYNCLIKILPQK